MIGEHYPLIKSEDLEVFEFISSGEKGEINKAIIFDLLEAPFQNTFNLALCTFRDGIAVDDEVTNNQDFLKTMYTVAKAMYEFLDDHPDASVLIGANEKRRLNIYNGIFKRKYKELVETFDVFGMSDDRIVPYDPVESYNLFVLKLKKT